MPARRPDRAFTCRSEEPRFAVDAMLGNVARELRLLGFDALFARSESDSEILRICQSEARVLVTRDSGLAARAHSLRCVLVTEAAPGRQTSQALRALGLAPRATAVLTRCTRCNTLLVPATNEEVSDRTPDHVAISHSSFVSCPGCGRVYWPGSHSGRLAERARQILLSLHPEGRHV